MGLDFPDNQLKNHLHHAAEIILEIYGQHLNRVVFAGKSPEDIQADFDQVLPEMGSSVTDLLEKVRRDVVGSATMNVGPHYYGYITGGGNQVAILADMISTAINQNNLKWHSSPISTEMEKLVIRWVCQFIGYPDSAAGTILDGGSSANFNCLAVARKNMSPEQLSDEGLYGQQPMTIYVSEQGHSSFDKAVDMLGIGKKYLRKIETDTHFRIDPEKLERQIIEDKNRGLKPICIIGIAGTTNTGSVDNLSLLAEIAEKHKLWYHVDAAYGGPAAALVWAKELFTGIEKADSVVINPHKWLYVPFEASCILVKEPEKLRKTFSSMPDYLKSNSNDNGRTDLMEYQLPLTKSFKSLKVWMTLKAYGAKKIRETIQKDIDNAQLLSQLIARSDDFELLSDGPLSIICFRYFPPDLDENSIEKLNRQLPSAIESDGRIFLTGTRLNDKTVLRTCFINPRTTFDDVKMITGVVRDVACTLARKL